MILALALYAASAVVLVAAGLAKLARPAPAADLLARLGLARLGLRTRSNLIRLAGLAECALGTAALAVGDQTPSQAFLLEAVDRPWPLHGETASILAAAVGCLYAAFTLVVLQARRLDVPSCGCLGQASGPPSRHQIAVNLVFAAAALIISTASPGDMRTPIEALEEVNPLLFIPAVGLIAGLSLTALTTTPRSRISDTGIEDTR